MRLETLDKLITAVRAQEAIRRPSVPEAPETRRIVYDRPFEDAQIDPDAKGARPYFQQPRSRRERIREFLEIAVDEANALAEQLPRQGVAFELATDEAGKPVVHVLDAQSRGVLRTLTPSEFLDFMARVRETIGLFFDQLF